MAVKVLCAGCSKEEKERAESAVRSVLGGAAGGTWMVSLVKIGNQWSVSLDGPGCKATFMTPEVRIEDSIRDAARKAGAAVGAGEPAPAATRAPVPPRSPTPPARASAPPRASPPRVPAPPRAPVPSRAPSPPRASPSARPGRPSASGERSDRYDCEKCGQAFMVVYMAVPDAPQERVAASCPHCWHVMTVMVAEDAAWSRDYRSEKA